MKTTLIETAIALGITVGAGFAPLAAHANDSETPDGAKSLERALDRSGRYVKVEQLADGTNRVDLGGSFQHVTLGRVNADGQWETYCVEHSHQVSEFLDRPAAITVTLPKEAR